LNHQLNKSAEFWKDFVIKLIEAWETLEALYAHLKTEHLAAYRDAVQDYVAGLTVRVLKPV
jgi:quinol monooxygenase YgiN